MSGFTWDSAERIVSKSAMALSRWCERMKPFMSVVSSTQFIFTPESHMRSSACKAGDAEVVFLGFFIESVVFLRLYIESIVFLGVFIESVSCVFMH